MNALVPGKAFPGERARRRAVERITKAGVPVVRCESPVSKSSQRYSLRYPDRQSLSKSPATAGQGFEPRPVRTRVAQQKVEVIRDQFRLYVWAAVGSFRRCDSCGTRSCLGSSWAFGESGTSTTAENTLRTPVTSVTGVLFLPFAGCRSAPLCPRIRKRKMGCRLTTQCASVHYAAFCI